ncbi:MAG: molybdopterin dinucleotide binding domain-containing protein, partial [Nitrososphaerales archaeon]
TIHPETARSLGIMQGDWVWVENHLGKCRRKAILSDSIDPRVVTASHGWWFPEKSAEEWFGVWDANLNQLIPHNTQSKYGFGGAQYKSLLCRVHKAEEPIAGISQYSDLIKSK